MTDKNKPFTIIHDKPSCIGCAACAAVAPKFWEMDDEGKSTMKGAEHDDKGWEFLDIAEEDLSVNKEAAECCPVQCIHIKNKEDEK